MSKVQGSLAGARIWLSGAVPDKDATEQQRAGIRTFVARFARWVFEHGGYIIHGSHPSLRDILLDEARTYRAGGGHEDCLTLVVSQHWSKDRQVVPIDVWRKDALVQETPEATGTNARDDSLILLRKWIAARCDAVVVVGGVWWQPAGGKGGVPLEAELAIDRGLPCFILGGLGGAAKTVVENDALIARLKNGYSAATNRELAIEQDPAKLFTAVCDGLERLPLVRGRGTDGVSFRILALDGGGVKGAFTAAALAFWEKYTDTKVVEHFDLIAGTSTGGILALGLGLGLSGQTMKDFYIKYGPEIFPTLTPAGRIRRLFASLRRPKYSQDVLAAALRAAYYPDRQPVPLRRSRCRLVIPTYDSGTGRSHRFRTPHHPNVMADADADFLSVALATSAAPTYFRAAQVAGLVAEASYFDGGVWANSPVMAAIVEAVCFLGVPLERIDVLSVGTTDEPFDVVRQRDAGALLWLPQVLEMLMNVQQESALCLAQDLVGPRFLRVNTSTAPGRYTLDGARWIPELTRLGQAAAQSSSVIEQVKSRFLNGVKVIPWQP